MVSGSSIATLVVFILSIIFVIYPVSFPIYFPYLGRKTVSINLTTAPIIAILVLWAAQCLGPREIRDGIVGTEGVKPYNIIILFFSLAYMAITLDITGVLKSAAFWVSNKGGSNGWKLFLYFYVMLTVLSVFIGNDPVILSGTAFLVYYTKVNELNATAWLMSEFAAANTASMVLFLGNPTNVVICEGFQVNNVGFTAYTILPFLACSLSCFIALAIQFRSSEYLPRKLNISGDLNVSAVLLDPVGACVGGALLGVCLIVIIVVSFFKVEVWMISLPFAFAKFLWDLGWDTYRYMKSPVLEGEDKESHTVEDDDDIVLKHLQRQKTNATINVEHSDLKREVQDGAANGITNKAADGHVDAMPKATDPTNIPSHTDRVVTFDDSEATQSLPPSSIETPVISPSNTLSPLYTHATPVSPSIPSHQNPSSPSKSKPSSSLSLLSSISNQRHRFSKYLSIHFRTIHTALPRLPFALVPFAFSQFILIEGLSRQGWIQIFAHWLVVLTKREMFKTVWVVGVLGVLLCNASGTNIGATILLTKIMREAASSYNPPPSGPGVNIEAFLRSAAIALAVASNIGAVSFTFSASLAGLLWQGILTQKKILITQQAFAKWNLCPVVVMTVVGLAVVSAEMAVLY